MSAAGTPPPPLICILAFNGSNQLAVRQLGQVTLGIDFGACVELPQRIDVIRDLIRTEVKRAFPSSGQVTLRGNLLHKGPLAENPTAVAFGAESLSVWPANSLELSHNSVVSVCSSKVMCSTVLKATHCRPRQNLPPSWMRVVRRPSCQS